MRGSDVLRRALAALKSVAGLLLWGTTRRTGPKGFVCVACHSTYDRQHYQCPQCGEMVVVALNADGSDPPRRGAG